MRTSSCHLARGVWPGQGRVSSDITHIKHIVVVACKLTCTWYRVYGKSPREAM